MALNGASRYELPKWSGLHQRGFLIGRQPSDNEVEVDTAMCIAGFEETSRCDFCLFFLAAFPSAARGYIWMVLDIAGVTYLYIQAVNWWQAFPSMCHTIRSQAGSPNVGIFIRHGS